VRSSFLARVKIEFIGQDARINIGGALTLIDDVLNEEGEKIKELLEEPTKDFQNTKVKIEIKGPKSDGRNKYVDVGTHRNSKGNQIYGWISHGVKKRKFTTPKPWPMRFPRYYSPTTLPGSLTRRGPKRKYGPVVAARTVTKGIQARNFPEAVISRRGGFYGRVASNRFNEFGRNFWV